MCPAGATELRDVLVTGGTGIVNTIHIPPVPGLWQVSKVQEFMSTRCSSMEDKSTSQTDPLKHLRLTVIAFISVKSQQKKHQVIEWLS